MSAHAGQTRMRILRFRSQFVRYYRKSTTNPRWLLMFVFSRFETVRAAVTHLRRSPSLEELPQGRSLFNDLGVDEAVERLKSDGYLPGIDLPATTARDILEFAGTEHANANGDAALKLRAGDARRWEVEHGTSLVKADFTDPGERCQVVKELTRDPRLWEVAAHYLHAQPKCTGAKLWWSFAGDSTVEERLAAAPAQELWHYDPVDYRALKFFFYLTDVDTTTGAHMVVRGSHRKKKLGHRLALFVGRRDEEMTDYYGADDVLTVTGPAGTGFAEDPFCFHRGTPPISGDRLMMYIEFRLS
jgi:hypothetical protein